MAWKTLEPTTTRAQEPAMGITSHYEISWTKPIMDDMGNPKRVELLYDQSKQLLGIRPSENGGGFAVTKNGRGICAKGTLQVAGVASRLEVPIRGRPARKEGDVWSISVVPELVSKRKRRTVNEDELS